MATERDTYPGNPGETLVSARLTADGIAVDAPCLVWGFVATGSGAAGALATIFDGRNTSGRRWGSLGVTTSLVTVVVMFPKPEFFRLGVFVDFSSGDMDEVTVLHQLVSSYNPPR